MTMGLSITMYVPAFWWGTDKESEYYPTELYIPRIDWNASTDIGSLPQQTPPKVMSGPFATSEEGDWVDGEITSLPPAFHAVRAVDLMTLKDREYVTGEDCLSKQAAWAYLAVLPPQTVILVWLSM